MIPLDYSHIYIIVQLSPSTVKMFIDNLVKYMVI